MPDFKKMSNNQAQEEEINFDFKYYLFKIIDYWQLFLVTIIIAMMIAKFLNIYQEKIYSLKTIIFLNEESNPLFSSETDSPFSWDKASDALETTKTILQSRTHNEKVISKLQFFTEYLIEGKYRNEDVYGYTPFNINVNTSSYQLYNTLIKIETLKDNKFKISIDFDIESSPRLVRYLDNDLSKTYTTDDKSYSQIFEFNTTDLEGTNVKTPFLDFNIFSNTSEIDANQVYYIRFVNFNSKVSEYRNIKISSSEESASILTLELIGSNKNRIVDYLNESVKVVSTDRQKQKNLYATKTLKYIDELFEKESNKLELIQGKIGGFKKENNIYNLSTEGEQVFSKTRSLALELKTTEKSIEELDILERYLRLNTIDEESVPVPAFVQLVDSKISSMINELIIESTKFEAVKAKVKPIHPEYKKSIKKVTQIKDNLFENIINNKTSLKRTKNDLEKELLTFDSKLKLLPEKEQRLLKYQKEYEFSESYYSYFKEKRYEAASALEASVSDIKIIDTAVDLEEGPISPKPMNNYIIALGLGIILPLLYVVIRDFLDVKIRTVEEIENKYSIPILGIVGKNVGGNNLAVFERPKSVVAESFRSLRSNIQFLFKNNIYNDEKKAKTLVLTSSISGEGKTMISINMATVFALSGKKTILIGMDLRKPKIFDDFGLTNDVGIVNYLVNQKTISEIIIKSKIPNLDIILSGPVPPNPSELILNESCNRLINELQKEYDYIIIDTPPVGIVSDALELFKYADAICYVIRQNYSKKGMIKMIDDKYVNKEVTNISYIFNDFELKNKYGYGYGYGGYGDGYHENYDSKNWFSKIVNFRKSKR